MRQVQNYELFLKVLLYSIGIVDKWYEVKSSPLKLVVDQFIKSEKHEETLWNKKKRIKNQTKIFFKDKWPKVGFDQDLMTIFFSFLPPCSIHYWIYCDVFFSIFPKYRWWIIGYWIMNRARPNYSLINWWHLTDSKKRGR